MLHIKTPLILHVGLSTPTRRIWLKMENLQPSGSFKLRGMGLLCSWAKAQGKHRVICPSGGNAGFATAVAAAAFFPFFLPPATGAASAAFFPPPNSTCTCGFVDWSVLSGQLDSGIERRVDQRQAQ